MDQELINVAGAGEQALISLEEALQIGGSGGGAEDCEERSSVFFRKCPRSSANGRIKNRYRQLFGDGGLSAGRAAGGLSGVFQNCRGFGEGG